MSTTENTNYSLPEKYQDIIILEPEEKIIKTLKRTNTSYFIPRLFRGGVFLIIYFVIRYAILNPFFNLYASYQIIMNWIVIFWAIVFGIAMAIGSGYVRGHFYVITNKRIVMIRSYLTVLFREIEFKRITDLVLSQSFTGRLFHFGNLMPVTAGIEMSAVKMGIFSIEGITEVFETRSLLMKQIREIQKILIQQYKPNK